MICHQGSARASPRLRQALPAAKGLSPHAEKHAFHPDLPPKATRDPRAPTPRDLCPPGGHGHRHPLAALSSQRWDFGKTPEHSASTPPAAPALGRRPRREQTAQMSRAARQAPAAAERGSCPASTAIPEPSPKACQDASRPASSRRRTHRGWWI